MIGLIRGMNFCSYQSRPFRLRPIAPGEEPGGERDAEEDQDGAGDLPDAWLEALRVEAEPARQHGQVEVAEERERDDLEERVEDDKQCGAVAVALAMSFQISTIAMQRASPTMITPVR